MELSLKTKKSINVNIFSRNRYQVKALFQLPSADLGHVKAIFSLADEKERLERQFVLDPAIVSEDGPSEFIPRAISQQRREYLYNSIRPYVQPNKRDTLCPQP